MKFAQCAREDLPMRRGTSRQNFVDSAVRKAANAGRSGVSASLQCARLMQGERDGERERTAYGLDRTSPSLKNSSRMQKIQKTSGLSVFSLRVDLLAVLAISQRVFERTPSTCLDHIEILLFMCTVAWLSNMFRGATFEITIQSRC